MTTHDSAIRAKESKLKAQRSAAAAAEEESAAAEQDSKPPKEPAWKQPLSTMHFALSMIGLCLSLMVPIFKGLQLVSLLEYRTSLIETKIKEWDVLAQKRNEQFDSIHQDISSIKSETRGTKDDIKDVRQAIRDLKR